MYTQYEEDVEVLLKQYEKLNDKKGIHNSMLGSVMLSVDSDNGTYEAEGCDRCGGSCRNYSGKNPKELLENVKKGEQF